MALASWLSSAPSFLEELPRDRAREFYEGALARRIRYPLLLVEQNLSTRYRILYNSPS